MTGFRTHATLAGVIWLLALGACAGSGAGGGMPTPVADYDRGYDFRGVKSIAIQPINRTLISTMMISDQRERLINRAITTELESRGLQVVDSNAEADLLLSWNLVTSGDTDTRAYDSVGRYNCWECSSPVAASVAKYTEGTFIVDMIDPIQLRSVWRSTFQSRMRNEPDSANAVEFRREAARAIFANFPPQ